MARGSAIRSFTLDLDASSWTGRDLQRPKSVVAEPDETLWASVSTVVEEVDGAAHHQCQPRVL